MTGLHSKENLNMLAEGPESQAKVGAGGAAREDTSA